MAKYTGKLQALDNLSLGISIVVAILLGVGVGLFLKNLTGYTLVLWIGVSWGIGGAILNIYKAYKKAKKDLDKLANNPKYQYKTNINFDDND
jgi:F0F1-type ATP synthase assembly protein I